MEESKKNWEKNYTHERNTHAEKKGCCLYSTATDLLVLSVLTEFLSWWSSWKAGEMRSWRFLGKTEQKRKTTELKSMFLSVGGNAVAFFLSFFVSLSFHIISLSVWLYVFLYTSLQKHGQIGRKDINKCFDIIFIEMMKIIVMI